MRFRSATDPRDHFFSLYGTVSRMCHMAIPQLPNPPIRSDYTMTVAEVYTTNMKSLLAHSRSLLLLSHVEDRSQRSRTDLPSWVPDVTVVTTSLLPKQGTGDIFDASKGALPQILLAPNLETLSLVGYWVDTVTETGDDYDGARPLYEAFDKSVALLLRTPKTCITGQDRVEAFWRTLIADLGHGDSAHPAPAELGQAFRQSLMVLYSLLLVKIQYEGEQRRKRAFLPARPRRPGWKRRRRRCSGRRQPAPRIFVSSTRSRWGAAFFEPMAQTWVWDRSRCDQGTKSSCSWVQWCLSCCGPSARPATAAAAMNAMKWAVRLMSMVSCRAKLLSEVEQRRRT